MKKQKVINEKVEPQQERESIEDLSSGFLNVQDVARYLKLRVSTVYSMVEEKQIPHYRVGRQIRFRKEDIDLWMMGRKEEVIYTRVEANKCFKSIEKKGDLDVDRIVKKTIEDVRGRRYTSSNGKPDHKGLRKEVSNGTI